MKPENVPKTVLDQFDEMKKKHPDAVLLFRAGDHYETTVRTRSKPSRYLVLNWNQGKSEANRPMSHVSSTMPLILTFQSSSVPG